MHYTGDFEEIYCEKLNNDQREIVDNEVLKVWKNNNLNADMIRAVSFKLLMCIGNSKGGDIYEGS